MGRNLTKKKNRGGKCSPLGDDDDISCLTLKDHREIAGLLGINSDMDKEKLNRKIKKYFDNCEDEECWLENPKLAKFNKRYKPVRPASWNKNPGEWLDNTDIYKVLKQYEQKMNQSGKNTIIYDPTAANWDETNTDGTCSVSDFCDIDIEELMDDGIENIGIVFNTDPSHKGGEHWVSMTIHLRGKRKGIYYFDSVANAPPKEVKKFVKLIQKQYKEHTHKNIKFNRNTIAHQKGDNECGVYCIYFIVNMLQGAIYQDLIKNIKRDKVMNGYRKKYFRY